MDSSIEDTSDTTHMIDKLRTIRPFTESQLLTLYNNSLLDNNQEFINAFVEKNLRVDDNEFYQLLIKLEKCRERHGECKTKLDDLRYSCESLRDKVWQLNSKLIVKPSRCSDGRLVEAKHKHHEAAINDEQLKSLEKNLFWLRETVANENCIDSYLSQFVHLEIERVIGDIVAETDCELKRERLKSAITALFAYQRRPLLHDNELVNLTSNWLNNLVAVLISMFSIEDNLYLVNHVMRCPAGSSIWSSSYIQCPTPLSLSDIELATQYMNYCVTVISTILSPILARETFIGVTETSKKNNQTPDDMWLLVDPDINDGEDITNSSLQISETDVIRYLKQIPFNDVLKFASMTGTLTDISIGSSYGETTELTMLKLLAFSTKLIQILKQGLQSFNCLRYKELTIYISAMIRQTVLTVAELWVNCKTEFMAYDRALILRLQVEFDHFMLRSIITILTTNRQGVWNFLSVLPFDGVSESMMWHILWVVYNNGRDEYDELGGLCPYFSATYWKNKFEVATVQFLFREKLTACSISESHNLLVLLYNMTASRDLTHEEFIRTVMREIFEISFQTQQLTTKMGDKGKQIIVQLCAKHQTLINTIIDQLLQHDINNEMCIELFREIPLQLWIPEDDKFCLLTEWITSHPIDSLLNRIGRIIFSRLNWSYDNTAKKALFLDIKRHQTLALKIYMAVNNQSAVKNSKDVFRICLKHFTHENLLLLAKSVDCGDFIKWCWNMLIVLKLNLLDQSVDNWDFVFDECGLNDKIKKSILELSVDSKLVSISRGLEEQHSFAIYIAIMMTDYGYSESSSEKCFDFIEKLLLSHHYIPVLHILCCYLPLHIKQVHLFISRPKLISLFSQLMVANSHELIGVLSYQLSKITNSEHKLKLLVCWTEIIYEVIGSVLKSHTSSWFQSNMKELQQIASVLDSISLIVFTDEKLKQLYTKYLSEHPYDINPWKLSSQGWLSSLFSWSASSAVKKYEWITPLHLIHKQFQNFVWLGWLVIDSDSLRMQKIWDDLVCELSVNTNTSLEIAVKKVCSDFGHTPIPFQVLPINSWANQALNAPLEHEFAPIIWFKFFTAFFTNGESCGSVGLKVISEETRKKLSKRLNSLIDHHHKLWVANDNSSDGRTTNFHDELTKLYRAYLVWLEDSQLHDVFVNIEQLPQQYLTSLLKKAFSNECNNEVIASYVNINGLKTKISQYFNLWRDMRSNFPNSSVSQTIDEKIVAKFEEAIPLPAPEEKRYNYMGTYGQNVDLSGNSSALLLLIQHNVRVVLEEAKIFENLLRKFDSLNTSYMELLPQLYHNLKKEIKMKVPCDKDAYDPNGCSGPSSIMIDFIEATISQHTSKLIERNRLDFENILRDLIDTPSNKVVSASLFIEKNIPILIKVYDFHTPEQNDVEKTLLGSILLWLNDSTDLFAPSKQIFTTLLDSLESISEIRRDETNKFILETVISNPKIIEYLAPRLEPGKSSPECFLNMYKMIQEKLTFASAQTSFVLLSKFDVSSWLKNATTKQSLELLNKLGNALYSFGNKPKEDFLIVLGLYRKHLQYFIIFHFPDYVKDVLNILLKGMKDRLITPYLWNDVLYSFGFFVTADDYINYSNFYEECRKYSNNQPLFSVNDLYDILTLLSSHFCDAYNDVPLEFLDHYKLYVQRYLITLTNLSFCWLNANSQMPPCDIRNVWDPFFSNWKVWLFPKRSTRFVCADNFNCVWDLFLLNIRYFIECFQGMLSPILSCVWQVTNCYIIETKAIGPPDLQIMHVKLQCLPWNKFMPNLFDIKLMYDVVLQDKYCVKSFISFVFSKIDWSHTLRNQYLTGEHIETIVEYLAHTLISLSSEKCICDVYLPSIPFHLLQVTKVQCISQVIVREFKLRPYLFEETDTNNRFILSLLKEICVISTPDTDFTDTNWLIKHKHYANSVSYLISNCCGTENDLHKHPNELKAFMVQCFDDLKPTFKSDISSEERVSLFNELFKSLNDISQEDYKRLVSEQYAQSLNFENPSIICDLIKSMCLTVKSVSQIVILAEVYICNYLNVEGNIANLIDVFEIRGNSVDDFLVACVTRNACLSLHMFLLTKLNECGSKESKRFLAVFINWCYQMKPTVDNEAKVLLLWYKTLSIADSLIDTEEQSLELIQSVYRMSKHLFSIVEENVNQGFLSFLRTNRQSISSRCAFLMMCLTQYGCKRIDNTIITESVINSDLSMLFKTSQTKFQSLRKNKSFVGLVSLMDKFSDIMNQNDSLIEMSEFIKNCLTTYYTTEYCFVKVLI